jgi:hypothetical protein
VATKVGTLLIDVAAGVARVENDLGKVSRILDKNLTAWNKGFAMLKVAASSWLAKRSIEEGVQALIAFAERGIAAAEKMEATKVQAAAFREEQAKLTQAVDEFSAKAIQPLLPHLTNLARVMREVVTTSSEWGGHVRNFASGFTSALPVIGPFANAIVSAAGAVSEMGEKMRQADEKAKALAKSTQAVADAAKAVASPDLFAGLDQLNEELTKKLGARSPLEDDDEYQRRLIDQAERQASAREKAMEATAAEDARVQERIRQEQREAEQARQLEEVDIAIQNAIERDQLLRDIQAETTEGRISLLRQQYDREMALLTGSKEAQKKVTKAYQDAEKAEQKAKYQAQLAVVQTNLGMMTNIVAASLGENHKITKAFAIAEALVNTYAGVTMALRFHEPPRSWLMAASSLAMGLKQVQAIRSSVPGGAAQSGTVGGGGGANVPATTMPAAEPQRVVEKEQQGGKIEVKIYNPIVSKEWIANELAPTLEELNRRRGWTVEASAA